MTSPSDLLAQFHRDIQQRLQSEELLHQATVNSDPREVQLRSTLSQLQQKREAQFAAVQESFDTARREAETGFDSRLQIAEQEHRQTLRHIEREAAQSQAELEQQHNDSTWVVSSVMDDSAEDSPARAFDRFRNLLQKSQENQADEWEQLNAAVTKEMDLRSFQGDPPREFPDPPRDREAAAARYAQASTEARGHLRTLNSLWLPRLVRGVRALGLFLLLAVLAGTGIFQLADPQWLGLPGSRDQQTWLVVSSIAGAMFGLFLTLILSTLAGMRQSEILRQLAESRQEVYWAHQHWLRFAKEQLARHQKEFEQHQRKIERDRATSLQRFEQAHDQRLQEIVTSQSEGTRFELRRYAEEQALLLTGKQETLEQLDREHQENLEQLQRNWSNRLQQLQSDLEGLAHDKQQRQQAIRDEMQAAWEQGMRHFEAGLHELSGLDEQLFPKWNVLAEGRWAPPTQIPSALRVGEIDVDLKEWDGATSDDPGLCLPVTESALPLHLPFPEATSLLFKSKHPEARQAAIAGLQCLMLRLLTLLPPGKLRFTIIDPLGLGESFSGFMHLADFDELLVTNRIWTESNQIEARLADLTEHMENVLQKYLRNEFQTIEEYNASAGEVAEPYHVLVIGDFPVKFSEIAARRLTSIINSGPRCGVYTLMNLDAGKQLPNNFSLADIETKMSRFEWRDGAFHAVNPGLSRWPVVLETPPPPEQFTSIVKMVGEASKDARRVEVSFRRITPSEDRIWAGDSRSELVIPLGRAGATKLQQLRLGKGTSQHMLVAGKTGSGKSTFLHILITNLALHYSPLEVNFFLIDFKKGVEFKDYATYQLPHARVIAVESDREFGVSALNRLGDILQERGELFRKHGVQDIAGYRNATGQPLPRILLVVDEFQEFFVEDDKISQNAALLLDRLVRQGRAFGIHVILGSQTLGGAYSLARSTLGQVAVRVALQCSEADAHLILSEDNTAARLLTRPGEAIYNDANGMVEGNHPFQIAWITDEEREFALKGFQQRLQISPLPLEPPIVFEGNIPSDLARNPHVFQLVREYAERGHPIPTPTIWLGDAVEIGSPASMTFHRQSGNHVLLVGPDADAALGVMSAAFVTLAASLSPFQEMNSLFVLDGSHAGSPEFETWKSLVDSIPVDGRLIYPEEVTPFLSAMDAELQRRETERQMDAPFILVMVYHIARFRDLRKADDDFGLGGFGASEKPRSPGQVFADLLVRGPAVGMHVMVWSDSYHNVERWFSRQALRELESRIAFQMNASDSSNLIDSPAASRLGTHRALLHRAETGVSEKFRPYGLPPVPWLHWLQQMFSGAPVSPPATSEFPHE